MKNRFLEYINKHNLIVKGDMVCVGLSGGADSVCLFLLLNDIKSVLEFDLSAFHVNHNLRGEDADRDMEFCKRLCFDYNIRLEIFNHDIKSLSKEHKLGTEEMGRICRRQDARKCIEMGATKIALAHHKNDLAETMIFNMSRGSSVQGLIGIKPLNDGFIHPMLCFTKKEIEDELLHRNISWCTDDTNSDILYTRNYLRHEIIAKLEDNVNSNAVQHFSEISEDLIEINSIIDSLVNDALLKYVELNDLELSIKKSAALENSYVLRCMIHECIKKLSLTKKDISRKHVMSIVDLLRGGTGREVTLPYGLIAKSGYDNVIIRHEKYTLDSDDELLFIPGQTQKFEDITIDSCIDNDYNKVISENNDFTKYFDYDIINTGCVIRHRRPGDKIVIDKTGKTKKLKDFFIDCKIDLDKRDKYYLLASGNIVHWIIGLRMGDSAKITDNTTNILKISFSGDL